jgi:hypothetical protein
MVHLVCEARRPERVEGPYFFKFNQKDKRTFDGLRTEGDFKPH